MVAFTTKSSVFLSIVFGGFMTNALAATTTDVFVPGISTSLAVTLTPVGSANGANTFLIIPTSAPPNGPTG
ncbi:hypothetical protein Clacol_007269 [Clathrus columnatus]|uniref:Uncharacterized protein n=1 Tax=Clathrus columnatus TaxID=1419009 RepID=A0AAV5AFG5_9AGAM|nr:hypothetical protein Clacol_007269 [Clathrus columnatus]